MDAEPAGYRGAVMDGCDNSGARNLHVIAVKGIGARLNRLPAAGVGDMVMYAVKKGKLGLRKEWRVEKRVQETDMRRVMLGAGS